MNPLRKHPIVLWTGGIAFLAGSLSFGGWLVASASTPGASTTSSAQTNVTANQGAPGTSPWPVTASGTVNVGNLPSNQHVSGSVDVTNFPSTQQVGGTVNVGNLPSTQQVGGTVNVGNLPATQQVAGTVNIGNLPQTLQVAGYSADVASETGHSLNVNGLIDTGMLDTTIYRAARILVLCSGPVSTDCSNVQVNVNTEPGLTMLGLDQFMASDSDTVSRVEDIPGTNLDVQIRNLSPDPVLVSYAVIGRTN